MLCVTGKGKITDELPDAFDRDDANDAGYQRRALVRVALTDPPVDPAVGAEAEEGQSAPEIDRDCFGIKYTICDLALSPRKGTAIVTFPAFADGMPGRARALRGAAREGKAAAWLDFPISVGLDEGGIAKPVSMEDVTVEKVGEGGEHRGGGEEYEPAGVAGQHLGRMAGGAARRRCGRRRRRSSRSSRTPGCDRRATPVRKHHLHVLRPRVESFARDRIPPLSLSPSPSRKSGGQLALGTSRTWARRRRAAPARCPFGGFESREISVSSARVRS